MWPPYPYTIPPFLSHLLSSLVHAIGCKLSIYPVGCLHRYKPSISSSNTTLHITPLIKPCPSYVNRLYSYQIPHFISHPVHLLSGYRGCVCRQRRPFTSQNRGTAQNRRRTWFQCHGRSVVEGCSAFNNLFRARGSVSSAFNFLFISCYGCHL